MTDTTELTCQACRRPTDVLHPIACPSCTGQTRNAIRRIVDLVIECETDYLRAGTTSPVFMVAMPAANYETSTYLHQSATSGRLCRCRTRGWETCITNIDPAAVCPDAAFALDTHKDDDRHPSTVLQAHALHWRRLNGHDQPETPTLYTESTYLLQHLTRLAQVEDADLPRLRDETTKTVNWLEQILQLGTPTEKGSRCPACRTARLQRDVVPDTNGHRLPWTCPSKVCGMEYTDTELAAAQDRYVLENATALTAADLGRLLGVKAATLRRWHQRDQVQRHGTTPDGHPLYDVIQVRARLHADKMRA